MGEADAWLPIEESSRHLQGKKFWITACKAISGVLSA